MRATLLRPGARTGAKLPSAKQALSPLRPALFHPHLATDIIHTVYDVRYMGVSYEFCGFQGIRTPVSVPLPTTFHSSTPPLSGPTPSPRCRSSFSSPAGGSGRDDLDALLRRLEQNMDTNELQTALNRAINAEQYELAARLKALLKRAHEANDER
jgi:hypothetical protein